MGVATRVRCQTALVVRCWLGVTVRLLPNRRARLAQATARKPARLASDIYLWDQVQKLLLQRYSPEQIAGILPRMFPDDPLMRVSHETIYTALYAMPRGELRTELLAPLRQARKVRRPRARGEDRRGEIPNMVSIHQRPPEVDDRVIPGHWEGDLIKGTGNASAVGTLVERTTTLTNNERRVGGWNAVDAWQSVGWSYAARNVRAGWNSDQSQPEDRDCGSRVSGC